MAKSRRFPTKLEITPIEAETIFHWRIWFDESKPPDEFFVQFSGGMAILRMLLNLQAQLKLPIPPAHKVKGKPQLYLVKNDDSS